MTHRFRRSLVALSLLLLLSSWLSSCKKTAPESTRQPTAQEQYSRRDKSGN